MTPVKLLDAVTGVISGTAKGPYKGIKAFQSSGSVASGSAIVTVQFYGSVDGVVWTPLTQYGSVYTIDTASIKGEGFSSCDGYRLYMASVLSITGTYTGAVINAVMSQGE